MKTVAMMINEWGGLCRLKDEPIRVPATDNWMRLTIESIGLGPHGHPLVSVAHYYEQGGDLCCDPDMTFEVVPDADGMVSGDWTPCAIQHATGSYSEAVYIGDGGRVLVKPRLVADLKAFARLWSLNLREQGFLDRFRAGLVKK